MLKRGSRRRRKENAGCGKSRDIGRTDQEGQSKDQEDSGITINIRGSEIYWTEYTTVSLQRGGCLAVRKEGPVRGWMVCNRFSTFSPYFFPRPGPFLLSGHPSLSSLLPNNAPSPLGLHNHVPQHALSNRFSLPCF